ncbi:LuxR family transcriptional regulator [Tropicimonas sp. IMCC34043]|uniref:helix-turn-helix transcriptional regulator n=1 Tax=Tropicimonas sp. IMCC34043 TaxID=2248760 RepID=UPI000E23D729|nr:LuxR family transcriptional regulator [Tropicimonas sp. IMCC34043]
MTLNDFLDRMQCIDDAPGLWRLMLEVFRLRGASMVSYRHMQEDPDTETAPEIVYDGFPAAFVDFYFGREIYRDSPLIEHALRTTEPFWWSDSVQVARMSELEKELVRTMMAMLDSDGLVIQVFGPNRRLGTVNLGFGKDAPRLGEQEIRELQIIAQSAHLAYCRLVAGDAEAARLRLSARECEVLEWIARGKSNGVIAEILGISIHTVDTHVRRIFRKLEVNDRTTAAIKGFGAGLVQTAA